MVTRLGSFAIALCLSIAGCEKRGSAPPVQTVTVEVLAAPQQVESAREPLAAVPDPPSAPEFTGRCSDAVIPVPPGPAPPQGVVRTSDAFTPRRRGWWKKGGACPKGSRLRKMVVKERGLVATEYACKTSGGGTQGPWVWLDEDGARFEEGWARDGELHGVVRQWSRAGAELATYVDGKRHGPYERRHDGRIIERGTYVDDQRSGFWRDGTDWGFESCGHYRDGKRVGLWLGSAWETTVFRATYVGGELDGEAAVWQEGGAPRGRGMFAAGVGTWTWWNARGVRIMTHVCVAGGVLESATAWTDEGELKFRWEDGVTTTADGRVLDTDPYMTSVSSQDHQPETACRARPAALVLGPPGWKHHG